MRLNKKGFTRFELTAVLIMIAIAVMIAVPLWLNFQEQERQAMDRLEATNAESEAQTEYLLEHWPGNEPVMYMFTGNSEICQILRHAPCETTDYASISFPMTDQYNDGGADGTGLEARARSRKVGDIPLIVVVKEGEIVYNSWKSRIAARY